MAFDILLRDGAAGLRLRLGGVQAGDTWLPSWPPVACSAGAGAVRLAELRRGAEETVEADEETEDASESVVAVPVVATVDVGEESRRQAEAQAHAMLGKTTCINQVGPRAHSGTGSAHATSLRRMAGRHETR